MCFHRFSENLGKANESRDHGQVMVKRHLPGLARLQVTTFLNENIEFTVTTPQIYYLSVEGPYFGEAQYSASYEKVAESISNSPPTWGSPTFSLTNNLAQVGETFSFTMGATDADGINGSISTHWIIEKEGVQTDIHTGDTYLIEETDIGGQILVKQSYTDNLGNFHESSLFSLATPVVAYSNSPANFNISLESGEYSVGETVNISFTVSDADGHQAISQNNYGIF